jgi:AcrR family transcriptional regulator
VIPEAAGASKVDEGGTGRNATVSGPRRSGLVQERSRRTRQELVNAALQLWTERGFDDGVEGTTVEEIVRAAGVTKGTFYFHFAHKEDILLEVGWGTSEAMFKEATKALAEDRPIDELLDKLLTSLARRITSTPRAVVSRSLAEFYRRRDPELDLAADSHGFQRSFSLVLFHAQESGQIPAHVDARTLADVLLSMVLGSMSVWIGGGGVDLAESLRFRGSLLLAGARGLAPVDAQSRR